MAREGMGAVQMSTTPKGLFKLVEEMGELQQVLGKLAAFPDYKHPGELKLKTAIKDELADVYAALQYFVIENGIDLDYSRIDQKINKFRKWDL